MGWFSDFLDNVQDKLGDFSDAVKDKVDDFGDWLKGGSDDDDDEEPKFTEADKEECLKEVNTLKDFYNRENNPVMKTYIADKINKLVDAQSERYNIENGEDHDFYKNVFNNVYKKEALEGVENTDGIDINQLKAEVNNELNKMFASVLNDPNASLTEKYNTIKSYINDTNGLFNGTDIDNTARFIENLYSVLQEAISPSLTIDQRRANLKYIADEYSNIVSSPEIKNFLQIPLENFYNDFGIDENISAADIYQFSGDMSDDDINRAINMAFQNDIEYDNAMKKYNEMLSKYNEDYINAEGEKYADIASKYNAQKIDNQVTNTAKGMGQSDVIANQLGNSAQYQNYAENLADNLAPETENVKNDVERQLNNQNEIVNSNLDKYNQSMNNLQNELNKKYTAYEAENKQKALDAHLKQSDWESTTNKINTGLKTVGDIGKTIKNFNKD